MTQLILTLIGGVGLILLGMKLMSDGLKLVAGGALRTLLAKWTDTPLRGVFTGFCITSAVQSSSAVTIATIGFVNAGLMTLGQVVWVIYGSNIGSTTTAWIVAFLGLKINVKLLAMPFIGLGMALLLTGHGSRRAALGQALAGFGLFFLGVEAMQSAFQGADMPLHRLVGTGALGTLAFLAIGFMLTLIMQSSSGAMALILTAVAGGIVSIHAAAAAVIGANVGTTTTGMLAVIGATPNAKRVAVAHLVFNLITGLVALAALPLLLGLIFIIRNWLELTPDPAPVLAVFHTVFNVLGVLLLWRFTPRLIKFLQGKFRTAEEDEGRPQHLDTAVARTPSLALNALTLEVQRTGEIARRMTLQALAGDKGSSARLSRDTNVLQTLFIAIGAFATQVRKEGSTQANAEIFPEILRAGQYFNVTAEKAVATFYEQEKLQEVFSSPHGASLKNLMRLAARICREDAAPRLTSTRAREILHELDTHYQQLRKGLLQAGSAGELNTELMVSSLDYANHVESMVKQFLKGWRTLTTIRDQLEPLVEA